MGYKVFTAGEEALASDVNSLLMSQTVARFASAAARSAALTAPVLNQMSALDSKPGQSSYWNGSAWAIMAPVLLSFTESSVAQGGITQTPVDINGMTASPLTLVSSRIIEMSASVTFIKSGAEAAGVAFLRVQDAGLTVQQVGLQTLPANSQCMINVKRVVTLAAGTYTFKLMAYAEASTSFSVQPAAGRWMQITDLGPA